MSFPNKAELSVTSIIAHVHTMDVARDPQLGVRPEDCVRTIVLLCFWLLLAI